jgi:hypothetical protein
MEYNIATGASHSAAFSALCDLCVKNHSQLGLALTAG